jgi:hypothetical protein
MPSLFDPSAPGDENLNQAFFESQSVDQNIKTLQRAIWDNHKEVAGMLLKIDSVIERIGHWSDNSLGQAAEYGRKEILEMLLAIDSIRERAEANNLQLFYAVFCGHKEIVKMLFEMPSFMGNAANVLDALCLINMLKQGHIKTLELVFEHIPQDGFNAILPNHFDNFRLTKLLHEGKIETLSFILPRLPEERSNEFYNSEAVQALQRSIIQKVRLLVVGGALNFPKTNPLGILPAVMVIKIATKFIFASYPSSERSAEKKAEHIYANVCGVSRSVLFPSSVAVSKNGGSAPLLEV